MTMSATAGDPAAVIAAAGLKGQAACIWAAASHPVKVMMNQQTALLGAASVAAALAHTPAS